MGLLPVFLLSALSLLLSSVGSGKAETRNDTLFTLPSPLPHPCASFELKVSENKMYLG